MSSKIADLAIEIREPYVPNRNEDLPYIGLEHVEPGTLQLSSIGSSKDVSSQKLHFKTGDILFGTLRPYFRKVITVNFDGVASTEFSIVRAKNPEDRFFILYGMAQPQFIDYATVNSNGARPRTKWKLFSDYELPKIPPSQRQSTGKALSAYDDMIENNRRRIRLLEKAAQLLYQEWFVHLRFPGHEHTHITDGVPEGWKKTTIGTICKAIGGGTPSTRESQYYEGGDIKWVIPTDVTRNDCLALIDSEKKITEAGLKSSSARLVPPETILMTSRASVGFFAVMDKEVCTNQGFINIVPHEDWMRMYLLHNLMFRVEEVRAHAGGTTYKEINKGQFRKLRLVIPTKAILIKFSDFAYQILQQVRTLKKQQLALAKARDLLLPRLMNGKVTA